MNESEPLQILADLGAIPSAPLHEFGVASYVARFLRDLGVPFQVDSFGNLIATHQLGESWRPLALVAHLDHPGLEITTVESESLARAALLGGVRPAYFSRPVPVQIFGNDATHPATIVGHEVDPATGRVASLGLQSPHPLEVGDFGVFDLPGFVREGDELAMRAADDLAGVAALLATMRRIVEAQTPGVIYAVFTRAEEIGLVGASLIAEQKLLPDNTIVISLECSLALPGAEPGRGPVIRVGDRTRSFHPIGEALLLAARSAIQGTPVQRQLLHGGTCEATAFGLAGYATTGVALPLVNYHNMGPDETIAAERIRVQDFLGEIELLVAACADATAPDADPTRQRLAQSVDRYRQQLQLTSSAYRSRLMV